MVRMLLIDGEEEASLALKDTHTTNMPGCYFPDKKGSSEIIVQLYISFLSEASRGK